MQRNLIARRVVETTAVTVYPLECLAIVQVENHSERVEPPKRESKADADVGVFIVQVSYQDADCAGGKFNYY
jgi:hypothetical protein